MMRRIHKSLRDRAGVAAVEFALLMPVLATLFFGLFEGSQAIMAYMKLIAATQTIADLVTQQQSIGSTDIDNFYQAGKLVMTPLPGASLGIAVTSVTFDPNTGAATVAWQDTRNASPMNNAATATLAAGYGQKGESVVIVQGNYAYTSVLHFVMPNALTLTQIAFSRPRLVGAIPHT